MLLGDLRLILRRLARQDRPFVVLASGTMAVGLWVATLIFGVANGLLLRPLPYRNADQLVGITASHPESRRLHLGLSPVAFAHVRGLPSAEASAAYQVRGLNVTVDSNPQRIAGAAATPDLFNVLDVSPIVGRVFTLDEVRSGEPVAVVSERLVQRAQWSAADAIGRTLAIDGRDHTIVGVMQARFRFPEVAQVWVPLPVQPATSSLAGSLSVVARLRDGARGATTDQLRTVANALSTAGAESGWTLQTRSLNPLRSEGLAPLVLTAVFAAVLLLLVVSANVAALMLARGATRRAEFGLMVALGASRRRIVWQLLMESAVIAAIAGTLGLLLTAWTLDYVPRALPVAELPEWIQFGIDGRVVAFTLVAALLGTFAIGLIPALQSTMGDVALSIRSGSRTVAGGGATRMQRVLVGMQLLVATVLLIGGGLMVRSYLALANADVGYDTAGVYMFETELPAARYANDVQVDRFYGALVENLNGSRDVRAAAIAGGMRSGRTGTQGTGSFEDMQVPGATGSTHARVEQVVVSASFFETLGLPLKLGRGFQIGDSVDVAVVSEAFVRRYFPTTAPVNQALTVTAGGIDRLVRIVGVAGDMRDAFVGEGADAAVRPRVYLPLRAGISRGATVYVRRSETAGTDIAETMRNAVRALDSDQPVWATTSLSDFIELTRSPVKWFGYLLGGCALAALIVACVGLYGVVAYGVRRREREFAIRTTFGASPAQVLGIVLRDALRPSAIGLALGIAGGVGLGQALASLLHSVPPFDLAVTGVTAALLLSAVLAATLLSAFRLYNAEPAVLLRSE